MIAAAIRSTHEQVPAGVSSSRKASESSRLTSLGNLAAEVLAKLPFSSCSPTRLLSSTFAGASDQRAESLELAGSNLAALELLCRATGKRLLRCPLPRARRSRLR